MTATFSFDEIIDITEGRLSGGLSAEEDINASVVSDTRQIEEGQWFVALPGKTYDGHDFLGDAFAAGALGAIVENRPAYAVGNAQFTLITVENTMEAFAKLAKLWLNKIKVTVEISTAETAEENFTPNLHSFVAKENLESFISEILSVPVDTKKLIIEAGQLSPKFIAAIQKFCA